MIELSFQALMPVFPEILLAVSACFLLLLGAFNGPRLNNVISGLALAFIIATTGLLLLVPEGDVFAGSFRLDEFARLMKVLAWSAAGLCLIMSIDVFNRKNIHQFEYPVLIMLACIGMGVMISAEDLITLYLGLELQSLALYILAAFHRDSKRSSEAGLKYFLLGALSSGLLLYGASILYGMTGTITFAGLSQFAASDAQSVGFIFGMVFVLAGLAFKISAVPFHMWTPDVYEGAPTPVTAFFSAAPKVAAMALLLRLTISALEPVTFQWQQIVVFLALASMFLGAFAAIGQKNLKRLMAYSSIANMGFALVGLAAATQAGVRGVILYIIIYLAMTLGVFACLIALRTRDGAIETIDDLAGLSQKEPFIAFVFSALMFSLAGIPPLAGFFAKYYVFLAAIEAGLYPLAVLGVVASVIAAYYYLRLIKIMYFDDVRLNFLPVTMELKAIYTCAGLFVVFFILFAPPLQDLADQASLSLF
jgi:NADH-quinone oxidoreductase subunit N